MIDGREAASVVLAACVTCMVAVATMAETVALEGATVHTVSGPVLERATVVISDGTITAVGSDVAVPADATRVDLDGARLYPGLINMSTMLGLYEIRDVPATRDERELGPVNPNIRAEVALNPSSELLPVARADGILAFMTYPVGGLVTGTAALAYTAGWTVEDLEIRAPVALVVNWPSMRLAWTSETSLDEQRREREARVRELDRLFADAEGYASALTVDGAAERDVKWDAMRPVLQRDIPLLARVADATEIRAALDWAEIHGVRLILEAGRDAARLANELAARDVPVIVSGNHMRRPRNGEAYDTVYREAADLHAAGVAFAFGTGMNPYGTYNARQLPDLAGVAAGFGLPPDVAVRAMTLSAAEIAGVADRLGSIEVGKEATLIATDGDVLEIRTHVTRAWVRGVEVSLDNKHRTLYDTYAARPARRTPR